MSAYLHLFVQVVGLTFPAIGIWTVQRKGARGLPWLLLGYLAVIVVLALMLSSPAFGNRLAGEEGYWAVARRVVALMVLTLGVPGGVASLVILATGGWGLPGRMAAAYLVFMVTAMLGFVVMYWWHYAV
jgi:hypothetical protein